VLKNPASEDCNSHLPVRCRVGWVQVDVGTIGQKSDRYMLSFIKKKENRKKKILLTDLYKRVSKDASFFTHYYSHNVYSGKK
jgi:hypothetical protein